MALLSSLGGIGYVGIPGVATTILGTSVSAPGGLNGTLGATTPASIAGTTLTTTGAVAIGTAALAARNLTVLGRGAFVAPANDSQVMIYSDGVTNQISSTYNSTGAFLPLSFRTADVERLSIAVSGAATFSSTLSATQLTSTSSSASLPGFAVSAGNGLVNSGTNILGFATNSAVGMTLDASGNLKIASLAGTGTRTVVVSADGTLSAP